MTLSKTMYTGLVNSPETTITNDIDSADTLIYVLDPSRVPTAPNQMTLGTGTNAETVLVTEVNGSALTVTRGFQGIAKAWPAGTIIARNFTEYDYNALKENVEELDENLGDLAGEGRTNETVKDNTDAIAAHLADTTTAHGIGTISNNVSSLQNNMHASRKTDLEIMMKISGIVSGENAWSDTLEDASGINTEVSSNYVLRDGVLQKGGVDNSNTISLLHFNGADGATTIYDETGKTWTARGTAQLDTAEKKFGTASLLLDGDSDYITRAGTTDDDFDTGDFCIDFWMKPDALDSRTIWGAYTDNNNRCVLYLHASDGLRLTNVSGGSVTVDFYLTAAAMGFSTKILQHVEISRTSGVMKIFVGGIQKHSASVAGAVNFNRNEVFCGAGKYNGVLYNFYDGRLDEVRTQKGGGGHTSKFTPPTTEYGPVGDAVIVWDAQTSEGTLTNAIVEAIENLGTGAITYYVSRDNGVTFTECDLDTITDISTQPSGTSVVFKAVISGDAQLLAAAWGGEV